MPQHDSFGLIDQVMKKYLPSTCKHLDSLVIWMSKHSECHMYTFPFHNCIGHIIIASSNAGLHYGAIGDCHQVNECSRASNEFGMLVPHMELPESLNSNIIYARMCIQITKKLQCDFTILNSFSFFPHK